MATLAAAAAARQAATLSRISSPKSPAQVAALIHRRGLAGAADHHGPLRINCWQDPMSPSIWKEEHVSILHFYIILFMLNVAEFHFVNKRQAEVFICGFMHFEFGSNKFYGSFLVSLYFVIVSLSGWGLMLYGGYKFFTRGKGKGEEWSDKRKQGGWGMKVLQNNKCIVAELQGTQSKSGRSSTLRLEACNCPMTFLVIMCLAVAHILGSISLLRR
ncbi:hypothetical protein SADUNF_Sadunf13G0112700 [Salix dunnii]|uniref:Uncharacterized protein n=1 Tax=Salix dunnii TaxID=1413687 RepID=A0A835JIF2_9ROSI|nr:hypothetical protein SADUNF_Sadunf13G0112700 [Salix dunnii]